MFLSIIHKLIVLGKNINFKINIHSIWLYSHYLLALDCGIASLEKSTSAIFSARIFQARLKNWEYN